MIQDIKLPILLNMANDRHYPIFLGENNLNIWAIRGNNQTAGKFDDTLILFELDKYKTITKLETFEVTCDPSDLSLLNYKNGKGCAIIKEGHHKDCWEVGFHQQDKAHTALVNRTNAITVVRDFNRDSILDIAVPSNFNVANSNHRIINSIIPSGIRKDWVIDNKIVHTEETGIFGINCHRASAWRILETVGLYSEGCIVHKDPNKYNKIFVPWIVACGKIYPKFSLTLITEHDYATT